MYVYLKTNLQMVCICVFNYCLSHWRYSDCSDRPCIGHVNLSKKKWKGRKSEDDGVRPSQLAEEKFEV